MIRAAKTLTGTPCRTSLIRSPELTSFTDNASRAYLSGHIHCSHRNTCGIRLRWTKNPAKVIWYNPDRALRRSARPPSVMAEPRRKFYIVFKPREMRAKRGPVSEKCKMRNTVQRKRDWGRRTIESARIFRVLGTVSREFGGREEQVKKKQVELSLVAAPLKVM